MTNTTIAGALAKAQAEMGKALKDATNPHFGKKYADLASVREACFPALNANGIAVIQPVEENEFGRSVVTRFIHSGGEMLECKIPLIIQKNDMQGLGSALTYARRYGLMALAGIAPEYDDGNAAVAAAPQDQKYTPNPEQKSWSQTIIDELPETATEAEKGKALADALCAQWKRKKTEAQLSNEWDRRAKLISSMEQRFPDLHEQIVDAYENRMMDLAPREVAAE